MATGTTRAKTQCLLFGAPAEMPEAVLPTYKDIMKYYNLTRLQMKSEMKNFDPSHTTICEAVMKKINELWEKASIPTVSCAMIRKMMNTYHKEYRAIIEYPKAKRDADTYKHRVSKFKANADRLFDICSCKCTDIYQCNCDKDRKVPNIEKEFLLDQRGARNMVISGIDTSETNRRIKCFMRKQALQNQMTPSSSKETTSGNKGLNEKQDSADSDNETKDIGDSKDVSYSSKKEHVTKQTRVKLPSLALQCDRYGVSDRAAASIATSVLKDVGLLDEGDPCTDQSLVIDRSKVRRERGKKRKALNFEASTEMTGLYYDGRKDKTIVNEKQTDDKYHRKTIIEEHIVVISELGSKYFGHISPTHGTGEAIAMDLLELVRARGVDLDRLVIIGSDGTAVNTGCHKGVIRTLERELRKPLQWSICLLHANEIPLRCLFVHLDGPTTGPKGFSGPIGKAVSKCEQLDVVKFSSIDCELTQMEKPADLSTDQNYLYEICLAISEGSCPLDLSLRNPGVIDHARWLTLANRILRLYMSTEEPTNELKALAVFVVKVYAPMWFRIKKSSTFEEGAKHIFNMLEKSRYLEGEDRKIVINAIQRNAFFAHPENILVSMLVDENPLYRQLGLRRILKARKNKNGEVRIFKIPVLNLNAENFTEMVDWTTDITEPPLTMKIPDEEINELIKTTGKIDIEAYPCHNQAVERHVKLVTEASISVCGRDKRDGFIRAKLESRSKMPKFDTKSEYV